MFDRIRAVFSEIDDSDLFLALGSLSLFFGCYSAWPPLGYIITGIIFLYLAYIIANPKHEAPPVAG